MRAQLLFGCLCLFFYFSHLPVGIPAGLPSYLSGWVHGGREACYPRRIAGLT